MSYSAADHISLDVDVANGELEEAGNPQRLDLIVTEEPVIKVFIDEGRGPSLGEFIEDLDAPYYIYYLQGAAFLFSNRPLTLIEVAARRRNY